jgi:hypothetical protein
MAPDSALSVAGRVLPGGARSVVPCFHMSTVDARTQHLPVHTPTVLAFVILQGLREGLTEGIDINHVFSARWRGQS